MLTYHEIAIRLILSTILGGIIGVERERRNQPAGLNISALSNDLTSYGEVSEVEIQ